MYNDDIEFGYDQIHVKHYNTNLNDDYDINPKLNTNLSHKPNENEHIILQKLYENNNDKFYNNSSNNDNIPNSNYTLSSNNIIEDKNISYFNSGCNLQNPQYQHSKNCYCNLCNHEKQIKNSIEQEYIKNLLQDIAKKNELLTIFMVFIVIFMIMPHLNKPMLHYHDNTNIGTENKNNSTEIQPQPQ
jgi:hypothetical protein